MNEKRKKVYIAGELESVEKERECVRKLNKLILRFQFKILPKMKNINDRNYK
jgi:hypothetical protein